MNESFLARGGRWVLAQVVLMAAVLAAGPLWPGARGSSIALAAAWLCFFAGAGLGLGGVWVLGRNRTIFPAPQAGSQLVTRGLYRWVRHPLYSSLMCLSAGWALGWASWPALAAGVALAVFLRLKAGREEAWLRQRFPGYDAYARRVRRFVPGLW